MKMKFENEEAFLTQTRKILDAHSPENVLKKGYALILKNDKCIAKKDTNCTMGCCHHYKNKYFGLLYEKDLHLCEYQKNKRCTAKCITCKMYMCDTLKKKGYNFNINNVITDITRVYIP